MPTAKKNNMDRLPAELIIRIFRFLDVLDLVRIQTISSRYLTLARDSTIWREECFTHSYSEAIRRRKHRLGLHGARLAQLRYAFDPVPGTEHLPGVGVAAERESERSQRHRAIVNWDPGYPDEKLNFYEEYISRHAPMQIEWLDVPSDNKEEAREATGVGILQTSTSRHAIAPLDDGSICIYDISARSTFNPGAGSGKLLVQSQSGLLSGRTPSDTAKSHAIMTETGAVECVSIDNAHQTGYFAVGSQLHQIDLKTLQIASTKSYPFPITALSQSTPLTIGTNHTIHLHDPRDPISLPSESPAGVELICGGGGVSHATLPQPGPLSILHLPRSDSIWIAGRFTSLLTYDIRQFPRLLSTTFAGARIASLSLLPHPYLPGSLNLLHNSTVSISDHKRAKSGPGNTIFAAGEYKGKGSLELYSTNSTTSGEDSYRNRHTAGASKLLAVAQHGGKVVVSDGDGNLRWFERDGRSWVRNFNLQDSSATNLAMMMYSNEIWEQEGSGQGDLVQKIINLPSLENDDTSSSSSFAGRQDIMSENLLLWTGDGRIGTLAFRTPSGLWGDDDEEEEGEGMSTAERAREDSERQYGMAMRRALKRNAEEVRFIKGLGMGYS